PRDRGGVLARSGDEAIGQAAVQSRMRRRDQPDLGIAGPDPAGRNLAVGEILERPADEGGIALEQLLQARHSGGGITEGLMRDGHRCDEINAVLRIRVAVSRHGRHLHLRVTEPFADGYATVKMVQRPAMKYSSPRDDFFREDAPPALISTRSLTPHDSKIAFCNADRGGRRETRDLPTRLAPTAPMNRNGQVLTTGRTFATPQ